MVCGDTSKRGRNALGVADESKRLKRLLTCASCEKEFARQQHISDGQESNRFTRTSKVVCAGCVADGFTSRNWQAYECFGACKRMLPKNQFAGGPNFTRAYQNRTLKCKACA